MAPQRQPQAAVVGHDILPFRGGLQRGRGFDRRGIFQQLWLALVPGRQPMRVVPVPRQRGQRAGGSQAVQLAPVQVRAAREIRQVLEGLLCAGRLDAPGASLGNHFDQGEAQPHCRL